MKPSRSVVVARTATRSGSTPSAPASRTRIASRSGGDPRLLADQDAVGVDELPAGLAHLPVGLREQLQRVDALRRLVARREERADVAEARRAEDGVDERVRDHVAVGVAREPARVVEADAAEHERHAVLERVGVDAHADPELGHPSGSCRPRRASKTVTVS